MGEAKRRRELGLGPRKQAETKPHTDEQLDVKVEFLDVTETRDDGVVVMAKLSANGQEVSLIGYKQHLSPEERRIVAFAMVESLRDELVKHGLAWKNEIVIQEGGRELSNAELSIRAEQHTS